MRGCVCRHGTFLELHRCRNQGALVARLYPARVTVSRPRHALKVQAVASTAEAEKARRRPGEKKGEHRVFVRTHTCGAVQTASTPAPLKKPAVAWSQFSKWTRLVRALESSAWNPGMCL